MECMLGEEGARLTYNSLHSMLNYNSCSEYFRVLLLSNHLKQLLRVEQQLLPFLPMNTAVLHNQMEHVWTVWTAVTSTLDRTYKMWMSLNI